MGWSSDTTIDLRFHDPAAWVAFVADIADDCRSQGRSVDLPTVDTPERIIELCGEAGSEDITFDGVRLRGDTWGKWHGDLVLAVAANYADGHVDFTNNDDGQPFRLRLRDGEIRAFRGQISYPTDPVGQDSPPRATPITDTEAKAIIAAIQSGQVDELDLRALIADPAGWIAESDCAAAHQLRATGSASDDQTPASATLMAKPAEPVAPPAPGTRPAPAGGRAR